MAENPRPSRSEGGELRPWFVLSPVYPGGGDGYHEPIEDVRDVVEVEARTKREAKVLGVRAMRADRRCRWLRWHDGNPYAGIEVVLAACTHGEWEHRCEQCDAEAELAEALS